MNENKLTIIILTHERHHVLARAIDYYSSWDCKIIIADSSKVTYSKKLPDNIQYLYFPGKSIGNKLYQSTLEVTSPYTCLCADDDFLAKHAFSLGDSTNNTPELNAEVISKNTNINAKQAIEWCLNYVDEVVIGSKNLQQLNENFSIVNKINK